MQNQTSPINSENKIKIYTTERFNRDVKKYENIVFDYITELYKDLTIHGDEILKKFNFKKMQGVGTFKIYSKIKGHRIHIAFGSQINNLKESEPNAIILFAYSREHDNQVQDAKITSKNLNAIAYNKLEFDNFTVAETPEQIVSSDFEKIYYPLYNTKYLFPVLDNEQKTLVLKNENALIQGVAGSGKTNICIDKLLHLSSVCKLTERVCYSTFSDSLLFDTKEKVLSYLSEIKKLIELYSYSQKKFKFELQIYSELLKIDITNKSTDECIGELMKRAEFLTNNVDFLLIKDIFKSYNKTNFVYANQDFFINKFLNSNCNGNYNLFKLYQKLKMSDENIYKEIYGLIFGAVPNLKESKKTEIILKEQYFDKRDNFSEEKKQTLYSLAESYCEYMKKNNAYDENRMAYEMLKTNILKNEYAVAVLDEVQDFSEQVLVFFKNISKKVFCVGDPNQMVNPTYFKFDFLKNLINCKAGINAKTDILKVNYRSSQQIGEFVEKINKLNKELLGNWNFNFNGVYKETTNNSVVAFSNNEEFVKQLSFLSFDNYCIVVASIKEKEELKKLIDAEILTVPEAKGLEYDCVILYNILTNLNEDWLKLQDEKKAGNIKTKQADENSYYRYLYNLFYVGATRARFNLVCVETKLLPVFKTLFEGNVKKIDAQTTSKEIEEMLELKNLSVDEILDKVEKAIKEKIFDVAFFNANKIKNYYPDLVRRVKIYYDLGDNYDYIEAGDKFLDAGFIEDAKHQYMKSNLPKIKEIYNYLDSNFVINKKMGGIYANVNSRVLRKMFKQTFLSKSQEIKIMNEQIAQFVKENEKWKI